MTPIPAQEEGREQEEDEDELEEEEAPSHLPLAPPSELQLDDISTTVDPSYIISMIRRLLPHDVRTAKPQRIDNKDYAVQRSETYSLDQNMTGEANFEKTTIATEPLDDLASDENLTEDNGERINHHFVDHTNSLASTIGNGMTMNMEIVKEEKSGVCDDGQTDHSDIKNAWEDCGCILWDLSASINHAEFMEICLGITGNLACHNVLSEVIVSKKGLVETVVDQLFLDDSTCLSETFRLLVGSLQGSGFASWAAALLPEQVILRILWIVGNTLNSTLLERSIEFLLAVVDNHKVATVLLRPLTELDLPNLVLGLLKSEISKLRDEHKLGRSSSLDMVLHLVEALSLIDSYSQAFSSHEELFHLVCGMIKLPDKIEVATSCVSAVVIIANLLVDDQRLTSVLSQDFPFLQSMFDMFPFVSDNPQARNALWCILASLLVKVEENDISKLTLHQFVSLFVDKFHLIKEDLEGHPMQDLGEDQNLNANGMPHGMALSLRRIACILEKWIHEKPATSKDDAGSGDDSVEVHRYKLCCYCWEGVKYLVV